MRGRATIRIPGPSLLDCLLRVLGKKRGIFIPEPPEGTDAYILARKEPFLRALLRPKGQDLGHNKRIFYRLDRAVRGGKILP